MSKIENEGYKYCPICYRGNDRAFFLTESEPLIPYQDTVICYECLSWYKTSFINKYPNTKSRNYIHLSDEELEFWTDYINKCQKELRDANEYLNI